MLMVGLQLQRLNTAAALAAIPCALLKPKTILKAPLCSCLCTQSSKLRAYTACAASSTEAAAAMTAELGSIVWDLQYPPQYRNRIHVVHGSPVQLTELNILQLTDLAPTAFSNSVFTEVLVQQLKSRQAARYRVQALVLSGPFLPSQLELMADAAEKQQLQHACLISTQNLHVVFSQLLQHEQQQGRQQHQQQQQQQLSTQQQQQQGGQQQQQQAERSQATPEAQQPKAPNPEQQLWFGLLADTFTGIQSASLEQLAAAKEAEQVLIQQLRLFTGPTWSAALQHLQSKRAVRSWFVVRPLMGPAGLKAARKLVGKSNLWLTELYSARRQQQQGCDGNHVMPHSSGSSDSYTRMRKTSRKQNSSDAQHSEQQDTAAS